ncbi:EAL domain-containing protein [Clostridium sp.]|uniref:sensor domain-containing protein n=1 Tax=Clostridium sp. TaxID=1506 RepID=UPI00260C6C34|nr:EAL domain-containing protein [Clostridium sp.]
MNNLENKQSKFENLDPKLFSMNKGKSMLQKKNKLLDAVFDVANIGICVTNEYGNFELVNNAYCEIYGYAREELIGKEFTIVVPEGYKQEAFKKHIEFLQGIPELDREWKVVRKDGKILDILVTAALLIDEDGKRYKVTTVEDVTDIKATRSKLNLISKAMFNSSEGLIFTENDPSKVIEINEAYSKITGDSLGDLAANERNILLKGVNNEQFYMNIWKKVEQTGFWKGEVDGRRKNKENFTAELMIYALKDEFQNVKNYVGILKEITDQKKNENRIRFLSTHNVISTLPNLKTFIDKVRTEIDNSKNNNHRYALFYINIDRLKQINDMFGLHTGDKLLKAFAIRLKRIFSNNAFLVHFRSDKFGVFLNRIQSDEYIESAAELLRKQMGEAFYIEKNSIQISCSIGISTFSEESNSFENLLSNAEEAMIQAKKGGGNQIQFYTQSMREKLLRRIRIETDLKNCIKNGELFLVYQPQIDIISGLISGAEALIRWKHKTLGMISPGEFIPIAEGMGAIHEIGEWALTEACRQVKSWANLGINLVVAVNISSFQLKKEEFVAKVKHIITKVGIKPESIELELTESALVEDIEECINKILQLKEFGIGVDIDDFGTGYSSLNYLRKLPLYKLKIDKSFIVDFDNDFDSKIVTKTIIDMAHNLRFKVIAEGAETIEQVKFLKDNGCDEIQGYYFSKPLLPEEFQNFWLKQSELELND